MRILWITNIIFPGPSKLLGLIPPVIGGWMYSSAKAIMEEDSSITLSIATVYKGKRKEKFIIDGITYYLVPQTGSMTKYNPKLESEWQSITIDFKPDIVHIHGTEFAHGLAFLNACPEIKSIVSIQGLVSVCERYYTAGLSIWDILKNITLRNIIKQDNILQQKKQFRKRGLIEHEIILKTNAIIGRTEWDYSHIKSINRNVKYFVCNETLREIFYDHKWSYENCEKRSIFLSQANYPLKGLHQVIRAVSLLTNKYPDIKVYIAGLNITDYSTLKNKIKRTDYGKYINSLITKLNLKDKILFTGYLNEEQICEYYLKSNLFICPSSIENSPNSLGEAQILGVPCLASYVGGIPSLMQNASTLMYRFEEIEMLAKKIDEIFEGSHSNLIETLKIDATIRHDKKYNAKKLLSIYYTTN